MSPPEFSIICRTHGGPATNVEWFLPRYRTVVNESHISSDTVNYIINQFIVDTVHNTTYENRLDVMGRVDGVYIFRVENNINDYFPNAENFVSVEIPVSGKNSKDKPCLLVLCII